MWGGRRYNWPTTWGFFYQTANPVSWNTLEPPIEGRLSIQVAVIFDFDDTLAEDSTAALVNHYKTPELIDQYSEQLAKYYDNKPEKVAQCFYDEAAELVSTGWDPPLAYMSLLVEKIRNGLLPRISQEDLCRFGRDNVNLYPGVEEFLLELKQRFSDEPLIKSEKLSLDCYIISGGIGEIVRGTRIADKFNEIYACEFEYDTDGYILRPKAVISFTEKTRYIFCINKGITREQNLETPYAVNADMPEKDRPVPLRNMVYVGDGPSDIPCMSVVKKSGGTAILVFGETTAHKAWEIGERGTHCPRDYEKLGKASIIAAVLKQGRRIARERAQKRANSLSKDVGYGPAKALKIRRATRKKSVR